MQAISRWTFLPLLAFPAACSDMTGPEDRYPDLAELAREPFPAQPLYVPDKPSEDATLQDAPVSTSKGSATPKPIGSLSKFAAKSSFDAPKGLRICNKSLEDISVAIGFKPGTSGSWQTKGWYNLDVGQCKKPFSTVLPGEDFYMYATGSRGSHWGKGYKLCVRNGDAFTITGTKNCEGRGYRTGSFSHTSVGDSERYLSYSFTGGKQSKIALLDIGDGVYVQGLFSDELVYIKRIDRSNNQVKVQRASDGTTKWVSADSIITREQSQVNNLGRGALLVGAIVCGMSPDSCKKQ